MTPIDRILSRLPQVRRTGASYRAPCPAHGGDNPTALSLAEGEDGAALLYCYSHGCAAGAIMRAIGLEERDLFPEGHPGQRGRRPTPGWNWKKTAKPAPVIASEKFIVELASLAIMKLLLDLPGKPPHADDASEAIAPYHALVEDLWAVYRQRQRHEDVQAAWVNLLPELEKAAPNLVAAVNRHTRGHLRAATAAVGPHTPTLRGKKMKALLEQTFAPVYAIVPALLLEGLTLLVGKPKVGKSRLLLALAVAIAAGGKALGRLDVEAGDVLFISLEDHDRRLQKRVKALLAAEECPNTLEYETAWPRLDEGGLEDLELWIQRHPQAKLIIIDTLKRIRSRKRRNGSAYDEDYEALEGLQDLANRHPGLAIVVNHHENKMGAVEDWMDRASGSTGLTGGVDGVASLRRQRGSTDAVLTMTHRDIDTEEGQWEYALKSDHETGGWTLLGAAEAYQMSRAQQRIYDVLLQAATPMGPKNIALALGQTSERELGVLYVQLNRMLSAGKIVSPAHGKYTIPVQDVKDVQDVKNVKDVKDGPPTEESLTTLPILNGQNVPVVKDGSPENFSEKSAFSDNLNNLNGRKTPEHLGPTCARHGETDLIFEGGQWICGLCLGLPPERIDILQRRLDERRDIRPGREDPAP